MKIDFEKGSYFCFACECHGDAFTFVKDMNENKNDLQAMHLLVRILKSNKTRKMKININHKIKKESKQSLLEAKDYYYGLSNVDWKNSNDEDIIRAKEYMKKRGFNWLTLSKCKAKITYNKSYEIIFPLLDNKEFRGWVCRTMQPAIEKKRKYLYNEGFSRLNTLCGSYGNCEVLYIVEGYMDMLKLKQFGVKDVVAILGWKISYEQIEKIKKQGNIKYIISALDNDKCGIKGTEYLRNHFKVIRFRYLKGIKDPGEMTKEQFVKMNNKTLTNIK